MQGDLERVGSDAGNAHAGGWEIKRTRAAMAPDSELILRSGLNVTEAVAALNAGMPWEHEICYVYSEWKKEWYKVWCEQGQWSLEFTREACVVHAGLVFDGSDNVNEAVKLLNARDSAWKHDVCYVFSSFKDRWFK